MKMQGKTVIVTGAANGIGRAIAQRFAAEGANVVVNDVDAAKVEQVTAGIRADGGNALGTVADVSKTDQVKRMVAEALAAFGQIDILVNNAGGSARKRGGPFDQTTEEVWDWVLGVNLKGTLVCTHEVIGHMMERRSGTIVNMGSIAVQMAGFTGVDYVAAKGGVIALTRTLAKGLGPHGITVNCVSPGAIETEGVMPTEQVRENFRKTTCLGRNGRPEEVAGLVLFLASEDAAFITGSNYIIDGGRSLGAK